jgi:5'-3' exonuclease
MLVAKYRHDDNVENVYLLTGDSDWKQLVNEKTTWVALREDAKHKRINMEMFAELTGYPTPSVS